MIESSSRNGVAAGKSKPKPMARGAVAAGVLALALVVAAPAQPADGCTVLLCLAAPSWRAIDQCVPPVRELLRDLARGRPFPVCAMAGAGNAAGHAWSSPPDFCPPHYTRTVLLDAITHYECSYAGAISVVVDGTPFTRTWWNMAGDSVTEFSPAAKARLGTWDTRFDDEYAAWLATLPPPSPVNPCQCTSIVRLSELSRRAQDRSTIDVTHRLRVYRGEVTVPGLWHVNFCNSICLLFI